MEEKKRRSVSLGMFFRLVAPYRGAFILAMVALAVGSGINLLLPEVIRQLLNRDYKHYLLETPLLTASLLIGLFAVQGIAFYYRSYLFNVIGQRVVCDLRVKLYGSLMGRSVAFYDGVRTGDLVSRIASDCQLIQDAVSLRLSILIRYGFQVVVGLILMAILSLKLTLAIILTLPVLVGFSIILGKRLRHYSKEVQRTLGDATTIAEETFSGIKIVKVFGKENAEKERFATAANTVLSFGIQRSGISAFFSSFVSFLMNAAIVGILMFGISLVGSAGLSYGDLTAFMLYGVIVAVSFSFVASSFGELAQASGAVERVFDITEKTESAATAAGTRELEEAEGTVEFAGVSFAYPTRPEKEILKTLSFTMKAGSMTALVGPSGAGKSTIASLLLRLYQPTSGAISLDGVNFADLSHEWFHSRVAIVPQDPILFAVSIAENVRYGAPEATDAAVEEACEKAQVMEFARRLPEGLQTICGERGHQLSGGERQRVAIARALLRNPLLLVLDEATSALDSENERLVQQALEEALGSCTSLVIAHRLSTVKHADQLIVLEDGEVMQVGTHESLSKSEGLYSDLLARQVLTQGVEGVAAAG